MTRNKTERNKLNLNVGVDYMITVTEIMYPKCVSNSILPVRCKIHIPTKWYNFNEHYFISIMSYTIVHILTK